MDSEYKLELHAVGFFVFVFVLYVHMKFLLFGGMCKCRYFKIKF